MYVRVVAASLILIKINLIPPSVLAETQKAEALQPGSGHTTASETIEEMRSAIAVLQQQRNLAMDAAAAAQTEVLLLRQRLAEQQKRAEDAEKKLTHSGERSGEH